MMIHPLLTHELSRSPATARVARWRAPSAALCLLGLLVSTAACSGSIDDPEDDVANSGPAASGTTNQRSNTGDATSTSARASTERTNGTDDLGPRDVDGNEGSDDDIRGIDDESSANAGRRRGGGGGARARAPELLSDAGDVDAGDVDPVEPDAGPIDAGPILEVDAGVVGDAGVVP